MEPRLSKVLDECIAQIGNRRAIKGCLAKYPAMRRKLEPLLHAALSIAAIPKVSPSAEFRKTLKARLKARLSGDCVHAEAAKPGRRIAELTVLSEAWQRLVHTIAVSRRVAVPVTVALLLVLASAIYIFWTPSSTSPPVALASKCTLSILSGSVELQKPDSTIWEEAQDSITLEAGSRVRTDAASEALLTFFEGSTLKLEADTEVEIQQAEYTEEQRTIIILRQWLGRTWSRVVRTVDPGSYYEIQTPSASAIVRGTLFVTEVSESGSTTVQTFEGLVAVSAQAASAPELTTTTAVNVPASYETSVRVGGAPTQPTQFQLPPQVPGDQGEGSGNQSGDQSGDQGEGNGDEGESNGNQDEGNGDEGEGSGDQDGDQSGDEGEGSGDQGEGSGNQGEGSGDRGDRGGQGKGSGNQGGGHGDGQGSGGQGSGGQGSGGQGGGHGGGQGGGGQGSGGQGSGGQGGGHGGGGGGHGGRR